MGKWWTQFSAGFLGGFSGKIVAGIIIAGCIAVGLGGPPQWFDWIAKNQNTIRWIAVILGAFVWFVWFYYLPRRLRKIPIAVSRLEFRSFGWAGFVDERENDASEFLFGDSHTQVTITNTSTTKNVSLDIFLHVTSDTIRNVKFLANLKGPFGLILGKDEKAAKGLKKLGREQEYFCSPVILKPQETLRRRLSFLQNYDSPIREGILNGMGKLKYEIEIVDHVSGGSIHIPVPGEYRA